MEKYLLFIFAMFIVAPAIATPSHTSNTFPNDELMLEDYTYTGQAVYGNTGVYSGSVSVSPDYYDATFTCQSGQYLPADSETCTSCPNGYTCAGGTFYYNANTNQGIVGNTINITWLGATAAAIAANDAGTMIYGGDIRTPQSHDPNAVPIGKHFVGWKFTPIYDFSTLASNGDGQSRYSKNENINTHADICMYGESSFQVATTVNCASDAMFSKLQPYEWVTLFDWGHIYGTALCSSTSGTYAVSGTPDESSAGQYCWCKATNYKSEESAALYEPSATMSWVFAYDESDTATCASYCANRCAGRTQLLSAFRSALLGQSN